MKPFSSIALFFVLAAASTARAGDSQDCCAGASCCDAADCSDVSACAAPDVPGVSAAKADEQRLQMVRELNRLVSTYVHSSKVRTELTKMLPTQPERVYRHPVFALALFNEADQALYTRICDYFDC
jgi:hypothetical protein